MNINNINKIIIVIIVMLTIVMLFGTVYTAGFITEDHTISNPTEGSSGIKISADRIWGSVKLILQITAVSLVVYTGIRYMFASADQKADIKKSLISLVIGIVIVFGTTTIIDFVTSIANETLKK